MSQNYDPYRGGDFFDIPPPPSDFLLGLVGLARPYEDIRPVLPPTFGTPQERSDIYEASQAVVEYAVAEEIAAIGFIDRAARPIRVGFDEYWRQTHDDTEDMPKRFFVDPTGFGRDAYRGYVTGMPTATLDSYHETEMLKDKPVMIVDTCIHTGESADAVIGSLQTVGFEDVRLGVVSDKGNRSDVQPDLVMLDHVPKRMCYPFGRDFIVRHGNYIHSEPLLPWERDLARAAVLRQEIREIIREKPPRATPNQHPNLKGMPTAEVMAMLLGAMLDSGMPPRPTAQYDPFDRSMFKDPFPFQEPRMGFPDIPTREPWEEILEVPSFKVIDDRIFDLMSGANQGDFRDPPKGKKSPWRKITDWYSKRTGNGTEAE